MVIPVLCERCGNACCKMGYVIPIREGDKVPLDLTEWDASHVHRVMIMVDDTCIALVDGICTIYDDRPLVCRDYEIGGRDCLNARKKYGPRD